MFERLNLLFVFPGGFTGIKRAEVFPFPRFWVLLFGIQPVLARFQLSYHLNAPFVGSTV
jgi:hypothetical protein